MALTLLQPIGYDSHSCGYCSPPGERGGSGSRSFGREWRLSSCPADASYLGADEPAGTPAIASQLTLFYQDLIDRGWRRSGDYVYQ